MVVSRSGGSDKMQVLLQPGGKLSIESAGGV